MSALNPSRGRRSAPGRERILEEARTLFVAHGYDSVSMQQIADAAQVNKATLFHHFGDKEGLFVAVMREEFEAVRRAVAVEQAAGGPIRDQLRRLGEHFLQLRQSDMGRLAHELKEHVSDQIRHQMMGDGMQPWALLRPVFERAMDAGEVRRMDPNLAVSIFVGAIAFHMQCVRFASEADDIVRLGPEFAATVADAVLDGIGTR